MIGLMQIVRFIITIILLSLYFFPFEFTLLPGVNTKMAMAGLGLVIIGVRMARERTGEIDRDVFTLSIYALLVSFIGFISITYNNTHDTTYATYVVSMWVWLSAAFVITRWIKWMYKSISVRLLCLCLTSVCIMQCILALVIEANDGFQLFVQTYISGFDFVNISSLEEGQRLYGIGAASDVAGSRFAAILIIIAYVTKKYSNNMSRSETIFYIVSFFFITIVGNMIARTTTVGTIMALLYWGILYVKNYGLKEILWRRIIFVLILIVPIVIILYRNDYDIQQKLRFAFEGFFSLAEKGKWQTGSNDILLNHMLVFPETLKTWLIGDGYFDNPFHLDPYYMGPNFWGFYMATDIGYLRFIFYFGLIGLMLFIVYFFKVASICVARFDGYKDMFLLLLLFNFILWLKVSTDIFLVFALFLCVSREENEKAERCLMINGSGEAED